MSISNSPQRNTFQQNDSTEDFWKTVREDAVIQEQDPAWQKDNLEYDLRSTEWICNKVKGDDIYAQHLYAAMCNRVFQRLEVMPILKDQRWSCSWRHAGGIIADMREEGEYVDWYCSGIANFDHDQELYDTTDAQKIAKKKAEALVPEGTVTHEIQTDLKKLGWIVLPADD